MKLVFTIQEVAAALQKSESEFCDLRPMLEDMGFPKPLRGMADRWSIMDVINWVNSSAAASPETGTHQPLGNIRMRLS